MLLTEQGIERPTYQKILDKKIDRAKKLFGEEIDTSEQSVFGKYIRMEAEDLAECYELLEDIYYSRTPNSARGQSLDRLLPFAGITRNPANYARHKLLITGESGKMIPAGTLVKGDDVSFYIDNYYQINEDGTVEVYVNCTQTGIVGNVPVGKITELEKSDAAITNIKHLAIVQEGTEKESDTALRVRFKKAMQGAGSSTFNALSGAISRVPFVSGVYIKENREKEEKDGLPPHSYECFVLAPETQDSFIAQAIFDNRPLGVTQIGNIEIDAYDKQGRAHKSKFSRAIRKDLYVKIKVLVNDYFEANGAEQIKNNVLEQINTLSTGSTLYISVLYGYIHEIAGVVNVMSLSISLDGESYHSESISANPYEVIRTSFEHIEIEVLENE